MAGSHGCEAVVRGSRANVFGESWEGREVAVVGLGKSGAAAASLLRRHGCRVRVTEARDSAELQAARGPLRELGVERVEMGAHTRAFLEGTEMMIVSPGIHESTRPIRWAVEQGLPILSEIELAFLFCPAQIVAVTGTNGKSTAVTLIAKIIQAAGRPATACGNLGVPFASIVDRLTPEAVAVVEVSSFQLLWCRQFRPRIGVLLNVGVNHMDRHVSQDAYLSAKGRLFQAQTEDDWAVLNGCDARIIELSESFRARRVWFGDNRSNPLTSRIEPQTARRLTENAQAVLQVARLLGISDPLAWQVIRSFRGLEHRMECAATIRGVRFVNDSKSTTPESLLFALSQIRGDVVVMIGGRDKGMDFRPLTGPLRDERIRGIILIGESRAKLRALLDGVSAAVVDECETLEEALRAALRLAGPGTTVLFSPACASFDMFRDFEDRGRRFKEAVRKLGERGNGVEQPGDGDGAVAGLSVEVTG